MGATVSLQSVNNAAVTLFKISSRTFLWVLLGYTLVVVAHAQDSTAEQRLDPITIEAPPVSLTVPTLDDAKQEARKVPGGANVVDSESFATGRASTLQDALGYSPGVLVQPRFGAEESRMSIRGSGIQRTFHLRGIKLLQDGVPISQADGSGDFQAVEPLSARYIEVYRGANALQYGATTLGGAVNFVTPTGYDADRVRLRGEAGSFGYYRLLGATGGHSGPTDHFATLTHYRQDGFRQWSEQENFRATGNVGYRISDTAESRFFVSHVDTDSQLPGNLTKAQLRQDPTQANATSLAGRQKRDFQLSRIANRTTFNLGAGQAQFSAFYATRYLWHPIFQVLEQDSDDYGIELRYQSEAPLADRKNRFLIGFIPTQGKVQDDRFVNVAGQRGARTADQETQSTNYDLYMENQLALGERWVGVVGAQATRARRKLEDKFLSNGDQSVDQTYRQVSPKIGARYAYSEHVDIFANVSRSFEPPSFGELTGGAGVTPLKAQKANTWEVGTRGETLRSAWDAALYYAKVEDELLSQNDATGTPLGTVNAPRTVHAGIELGLAFKLGERVEWRNAYLWNNFRFDDHPVYGDKRLPGVPIHMYRGELLYRPLPAYYIGPTVEWSAQRYPVDMANSLYNDSYAVWGLKGGTRVTKGMSWFVEARNLSDKKYASTTGVIADAQGADSAQFLPGDGRSYYAGLDWRL